MLQNAKVRKLPNQTSGEQAQNIKRMLQVGRELLKIFPHAHHAAPLYVTEFMGDHTNGSKKYANFLTC